MDGRLWIQLAQPRYGGGQLPASRLHDRYLGRGFCKSSRNGARHLCQQRWAHCAYQRVIYLVRQLHFKFANDSFQNPRHDVVRSRPLRQRCRNTTGRVFSCCRVVCYTQVVCSDDVVCSRLVVCLVARWCSICENHCLHGGCCGNIFCVWHRSYRLWKCNYRRFVLCSLRHSQPNQITLAVSLQQVRRLCFNEDSWRASSTPELSDNSFQPTAAYMDLVAMLDGN